MSPQPRHGGLPNAVKEAIETPPSIEEIETTLRVLDFCVKARGETRVDEKTPLNDVVRTLKPAFAEPFSH